MFIYIIDQNYKWLCMFCATDESFDSNTAFILKIRKGSTLLGKKRFTGALFCTLFCRASNRSFLRLFLLYHGGSRTFLSGGNKQHGVGSPGEIYTAQTDRYRGVRFRVVSDLS